jgi:hypothetical protein
MASQYRPRVFYPRRLYGYYERQNGLERLGVGCGSRGLFEDVAVEKNGRPFNKALENRLLREGPVAGRAKGSIELRVQNISTVLVRMGLNRIEGYKPAKNVRADARTATPVSRLLFYHSKTIA